MEIGTFHGCNVLSVAETYAKHPSSKLYCIDPWEDYNEYPEYQGNQKTNYEIFLKNVARAPYMEKINIHRGYSHIEVPKLPDDFFDIIYIDGNHEPEYVMEDAVISIRKLKKGGILIFDDYDWDGPRLAIDSFKACYQKQLTIIGVKWGQFMFRKN
jgi:predicted O-methyltransferase YrrM